MRKRFNKILFRFWSISFDSYFLDIFLKITVVVLNAEYDVRIAIALFYIVLFTTDRLEFKGKIPRATYGAGGWPRKKHYTRVVRTSSVAGAAAAAAAVTVTADGDGHAARPAPAPVVVAFAAVGGAAAAAEIREHVQRVAVVRLVGGGVVLVHAAVLVVVRRLVDGRRRPTGGRVAGVRGRRPRARRRRRRLGALGVGPVPRRRRRRRQRLLRLEELVQYAHAARHRLVQVDRDQLPALVQEQEPDVRLGRQTPQHVPAQS